MSNPKDHHHVPQFYLAGWHGADKRLAVYAKKYNRLVIDRTSAEHTGYMPYLYSISSQPDDPQWVETVVMAKLIDDPASRIHARLLQGDLNKLNADDRSIWARFMMAQWRRTPEFISKLREDGESAAHSALTERPEEFEAVRGDLKVESLLEFAEEYSPGIGEKVALGRILPKLINDPKAGEIIINMRWAIMDLKGLKVDLLTSDRPVTLFGGLDSSNCMIMIPLDPSRLFVALNGQQIRGRPIEIVRKANTTTVMKAYAQVFGTGNQHRPLAAKHFEHWQNSTY